MKPGVQRKKWPNICIPGGLAEKNGHITELCPCRKEPKKRQKKSSRNTQEKNGWKHPQVATPTEEKNRRPSLSRLSGRGDGLG